MRNALLLSVDEDTEEIRSLLTTLGISVADTVIQKRGAPNPKTFLGSGKIDEIVKAVSEKDFDCIVVNGVLRPSQHHTLEMRFGKQCIDRIGVILRIFAEHARTDEAKRQVTLATLRYELPFLREWIHKAKAGERPGFLSGGAYATEVYYEHARSHIKKIEEDVASRASQRELRRRRRRERGYFLVSVAGYTNAGKSALLNALCDTDVHVGDKLFATLSTTTRRMKRSGRNVLMTDTVGFISDLPASLVHAFRSTFEEVFLADMVLLAVDTTDSAEVIEKKIGVCLKEISSQLEPRPLIFVGTKSDLLERGRIEETKAVLQRLAGSDDVVLTSSADGTGLDELMNMIEQKEVRNCQIKAILPSGGEGNSFISELHQMTDIEELGHSETGTEVLIMCCSEDFAKILGRIRRIKGKVLTSETA